MNDFNGSKDEYFIFPNHISDYIKDKMDNGNNYDNDNNICLII